MPGGRCLAQDAVLFGVAHRMYSERMIVQRTRFTQRRPIVEPIFTMRQVIDKTKEFGKKAYIDFKEFKAAFDSMYYNPLSLILLSVGQPDKYCKLFEKLYEETESCVQVNGKRTVTFDIKTVVRQGCAVTSELFN
ncbi:hypothetical protein QYM36_014087 [Artemia franciscana]|uniref:Uncharacterized protein n=1 Tax=Artemia franciscana TaxID=6661 RepID=A0AA88HIU7_ARTSF|nr:hypothetical protein QYM36_014087 [Artemia franciscana]